MQSRPLNILVRPCYSFFLKNRLFLREHEHSAHWMEPLVLLKKSAEDRGWQMNTWDMTPLESADVILSQDLPRHDEFLEAREKAPKAKFILLIFESPLSRPQAWDRANHDQFDAVLTYDRHLVDSKRYFEFCLAVGEPPVDVANKSFSDRRPLVLINSNRWIGWLSNRQAGLAGLPFVGPMFSGWHVPMASLLSQNRGEQYSHRRKLARLADQEFPGLLDAFGHGWKGEPASWVHKLLPHRPFGCGKGAFNGDKVSLISNYRFGIAFENLVADRGYISEKMFDMLYAGVVPIYLGDEHVTDRIPADCFVDARQFKGDDRKLLQFVASCDQSTWEEYRKAGQRFVSSPAVRVFQPAAFAESVLRTIEAVL